MHAVIFIMAGIAVFLAVRFYRQYRAGTSSRKEATVAYNRHKARTPVHELRLAKFDRIVFDAISKRKSMSKEDYDFLMESIALMYTDESEIKAITEQVNSIYRKYGEGNRFIFYF